MHGRNDIGMNLSQVLKRLAETKLDMYEWVQSGISLVVSVGYFHTAA